MDQKQTVQLAARIPASHKQFIAAEAERRYLKESDIVREALREYVARRAATLQDNKAEKAEVGA